MNNLFKLKTKIIISLIFSLFLITPNIVSANGLAISYPGSPNPLFNETNITPDDIIQKTVTITNSETKSQKAAIKLYSGASSALKEHLVLLVIGDSGLIAGPKKLSEFYSTGAEVDLRTIGAQKSENFMFEIYVDRDMGNEFQGKTESFNLAIGFVGEEPPVINPTTTTETTQPSVNPISGIVATVSRLFVQPTQPSNPVLEQISGEVAGTTDENKSDQKEVKGSETQQSESGAKACPWWWIVLILLVLSLVLFVVYLATKGEPNLWWIYPIIIGLVAYIAHLMLEQNYEPTKYCDWFWALDLAAVLIITSLYWSFFRKKKENPIL